MSVPSNVQAAGRESLACPLFEDSPEIDRDIQRV